MFDDQETITIRVSADAVLDEGRLSAMVTHRSMRIDGPAFRGRPLGHGLDPLRCAIAPLDEGVFEKLVQALLDAHGLRDVIEVEPSRVLIKVGPDGHRLKVLVGTLHTTYEYPFAGSIEYGHGPDLSAPRSEGQWFSAIGKVAIVIHSRIADAIESSPDLPQLLVELEADGVGHVLVFSNDDDMKNLYPYRQLFGTRNGVPQGLTSITYNVLVATLIFLQFQQDLSWTLLNYQYDW